MNEFHFEVFGSAIHDTKGLYRLIDQLNSISKLLYHNQAGFISQKVFGQVNQSLVSVFQAIEQRQLEPEGDMAQKEFLEGIIGYLKALPQVKMTLAFEPDDNFTIKLNEIVSALVGKKVVLDFLVNHHIVGGVVLEFAGKFHDYSLEPRVEGYLEEKLKSFFNSPQLTQSENI